MVLLLLWRSCAEEHLPNFAKYPDVEAKKTAFFDYLLPNITAVNAEILQDRERLLHIRDELAEDGGAGFFDERWLRNLAEAYDLEPPEELDAAFANRLLRRVDIIPASLVLAQAANESAWGTSRFALHGNNLFGMRTYDGEGIVPRRRAAGKTFKVASYDSVRESIAAYVRNLNTHIRYRSLRRIRDGQRQRNESPSGHALANGLLAYSTRGSEYVSIIQSMIRTNDLSRYDG
jgi:Bax protein